MSQGKRKARDQLSPYNLNNDDFSQSEEINEKNIPTLKKARARRSSNTSTENKQFKGIFTNVSICDEKNEHEEKIKMNDEKKSKLISGLNKSLLKAITIILDKQSDKDLEYIFEQYLKYLKEIKEDK